MPAPPPHVHSGAGQSLVLLALLWLPAALVLSRRALRWAAPRHGLPARLIMGWEGLGAVSRAGLLLMIVAAVVHVALLPEHAGDSLRAWLFAADACALLLVAAAAPLGVVGWRTGARVLLAAAVIVYVVYVATGQEQPDAIGLGTKLVELAALALLGLDPRAARSQRAPA